MEIVNDQNFEEEVLKSAGLVLVDFWADWCGPCKRQTPILETFATENPDVKVFSIDADENQLTSKQLNVKGLPTMIFFRDGVEVSRKIGLTSLEKLKAEVK